MILHILTDDKFTDYAIKQFSAPEMKSEFICLDTAGRMDLVTLRDKVLVMNAYSQEFEHYVKEKMPTYDAIVMHSMFFGRWQSYILKNMPDSLKVAWVFWGGEIYGRREIKEQFLAPITRCLNRIYVRIKGVNYDKLWEIPIELYNRVDICLSDEQEEYEFAKQYTGAAFQYMWYNYYSIEETVGLLADKRCYGNNIWIGNSSSVTNNHFDILWNLWKKRLLKKQERNIIIPMSYGSPWVCKYIKKICYVLFNKRARVLETFMPKDEYNALMLSCSTMIIGYWAPAAQGNIITGLWLGMRVYLSERSMTYHYFRRIGCKVYSIEHDLNRKNPDVFAPMTQEDIDTNRAVLKKCYSKEEMHKRNLEIVKALS